MLVPGEREHGSLDLVGAASATVGVGSIVYALASGNTSGWGDAATLGCLVAGVVLLTAFVVRERTYREPLVRPRCCGIAAGRAPTPSCSCSARACKPCSTCSPCICRPVRGYSPLHAGLNYLPFVVGIGISSGGLGPRLLATLPARIVIGAGLILFAGGLAWCASQLTPASAYAVAILPTLLAAGLGTGLVYVGSTAVGMHGVAPHESGIAAGMLNSGIQVGAALGLSAMASVASIVTRSRLSGHTVAGALTDGYVAGLVAGAAIFALGAVAAFATIRARISPDEVTRR